MPGLMAGGRRGGATQRATAPMRRRCRAWGSPAWTKPLGKGGQRPRGAVGRSPEGGCLEERARPRGYKRAGSGGPLRRTDRREALDLSTELYHSVIEGTLVHPDCARVRLCVHSIAAAAVIAANVVACSGGAAGCAGTAADDTGGASTPSAEGRPAGAAAAVQSGGGGPAVVAVAASAISSASRSVAAAAGACAVACASASEKRSVGFAVIGAIGGGGWAPVAVAASVARVAAAAAVAAVASFFEAPRDARAAWRGIYELTSSTAERTRQRRSAGARTVDGRHGPGAGAPAPGRRAPCGCQVGKDEVRRTQRARARPPSCARRRAWGSVWHAAGAPPTR